MWVSFSMAGIIALLSGYSFVQMGIRFPSRGVVVEYLVQAYGPRVFSGACSILFYIAQLIGMSMIALAFGKYSARLLGLETDIGLWDRISGSGLVITLCALQLLGSKSISTNQMPGTEWPPVYIADVRRLDQTDQEGSQVAVGPPRVDFVTGTAGIGQKRPF